MVEPDVDALAAALAFVLQFQGRKRIHGADEMVAEIVKDSTSHVGEFSPVADHHRAVLSTLITG